jgi:hypothetical protein
MRLLIVIFFLFLSGTLLHSQTLSFSTLLRSSSGYLHKGIHLLELRLVDKTGAVYTQWNQKKRVLLAEGAFHIELGDPHQGSIGIFPEDLLNTHVLEIVENGNVLERVSFSSEPQTQEQSPISTQGAKVLLSDIDQGTATNNQVMTWVSSEQSWRPRTPQTSGGTGTTGVNTINAQKGDITVEGAAPVVVNVSNNKISVALSNDAIPKNTGVPVGTIVAFFGNSNRIPVGWLLCDGRAFNRSEYAELSDLLDNAGLSNTNTPDLRGQFLRGVNLNRDAATGDPDWDKRNGTGEKIGSRQEDAFQGHWHEIGESQNPSGGIRQAMEVGRSVNTDLISPNTKLWPSGPATFAGKVVSELFDYSGSSKLGYGIARVTSETRPKNIAIHWIIKAKQ